MVIEWTGLYIKNSHYTSTCFRFSASPLNDPLAQLFQPQILLTNTTALHPIINYIAIEIEIEIVINIIGLYYNNSELYFVKYKPSVNNIEENRQMRVDMSQRNVDPDIFQ